ncbi:hypothetical protein L9F63_006342 [Diploptera punctata]|uniref:Osiris 20 n=1 Tax=Diploptera punctata TaxID=6984 RepID=A0AAD8E5A2_DIPPU|nr:hypothetical protein L9F63_006342 [Diploptera punctata]
MILPILLLAYSLSCSAVNIQDNEVDTSRSINSGEELLSAVYNDCIDTDKDVSAMSCLRVKVLAYLDSVMGAVDARSLDESDVDSLDSMILTRVTRYLKTHQFKVHLPEFLFQEAVLTFRPGRSLTDFQIDFPKLEDEDRAISEARGMLKKKLLLPLLLLVKLKLKALMPIFVAIIGVKALKALILSKLAILLVAGFLIMQLCKKNGMAMPMMPMTVEPAGPTPYGAPAMGASTPSSSYEPSWDTSASSGGPYSRVYDPHQIAYSGYYSQQQTQSGQSQTSQS